MTRSPDSRNVISYVRGVPPVEWLFLSGDRTTVALAIGAFMTLVVGLALAAFQPELDGQRMRWLLNGIVNGLLSLVTVILTINQLILSRQFGSPQDQYDSLAERINFREDVEDLVGGVIAPSQPAGFLAVLFRALRGRARTFGRMVDEGDHGDRFDSVTGNYVETITGNTEQVLTTLETQSFEMEGVVQVLNYDDSWQFYATRRFQKVYAEALSDAEEEALADIFELQKQIDAARQYFETMYIQRELFQLSRQVVYVGVVAILTAGLTIMVYRNQWDPTLGYPARILLMSVVIGVSLSPVALLFSYALRLATVTRRTVVLGPFTPREEKREDSDWNL